MESLEYRFMPSFRRCTECSSVLQNAFGELSDAIRLGSDDSVRCFLQQLPEFLITVLYAQCLMRLEIAFGDVNCRIHVDYTLSDDTQDELDFSMLRHVEWRLDEFVVRLVVGDVEYASLLLGSRLAELANERVRVEISCDEQRLLISHVAVEEVSPAEQGLESEVLNEHGR